MEGGGSTGEVAHSGHVRPGHDRPDREGVRWGRCRDQAPSATTARRRGIAVRAKQPTAASPATVMAARTP